MRYRKISVCIWNDERVNSLSNDGKLAYLFILTHPHMLSLGIMRATVEGMSAELNVPPEAFREVFRKGLAKANEKASCIYLPKFLKHNPPESPNVVKSWVSIYELIPECDLKCELLQSLKGFTEGLGKAFAEALPKAMLNPDPDPDPDPDPRATAAGGGGGGEGEKTATPKPRKERAEPTGPQADLGRLWQSLFLEYRGFEYKAQKADFINIAKLLKLFAGDAAQVEAIFRFVLSDAFWREETFFNPESLSPSWVSAGAVLNKIRSRMNGKPQPQTRPQAGEPMTSITDTTYPLTPWERTARAALDVGQPLPEMTLDDQKAVDDRDAKLHHDGLQSTHEIRSLYTAISIQQEKPAAAGECQR